MLVQVLIVLRALLFPLDFGFSFEVHTGSVLFCGYHVLIFRSFFVAGLRCDLQALEWHWLTQLHLFSRRSRMIGFDFSTTPHFSQHPA